MCESGLRTFLIFKNQLSEIFYFSCMPNLTSFFPAQRQL